MAEPASCRWILTASGAFRARRRSSSCPTMEPRMVDVIRVTRDESSDNRSAARMARDQRSRRLCLGDDFRGDHPAVPRVSDRGIAAAARPHGGVEAISTSGSNATDGTVANLREQGRFLDFTLKMGLPSWRHEILGMVIEKSVVMPSGHNIVHVTFRLLDGGRRARLRLRPFVNFHAIEAPVGEALASGYALTARGQRYEIAAGPDLPTLNLAIEGREGATFTADGGSRRECFFENEAQRGYDSRGWLWSPGYFTGTVGKDSPLTLVAATEPWHTISALDPDDALVFEGERRRRLIGLAAQPAQSGFGAELVLAADAFVIAPVGRVADVARAHAEGDYARDCHRRLPLVYRLGSRHDDLTRGPHAVDGAICRGACGSCAPLPTTCATARSRTCSRKGAARAFTTPRMRPCGTSMRWIAMSSTAMIGRRWS